MSAGDRMDLLEHWRCPICGTIDGPISDRNCDVCAQEGITERVRPLVEASGYADHAGAVDPYDALEAMLAMLDRHDQWCGHKGDSPGDGIVNRAPEMARGALRHRPRGAVEAPGHRWEGSE